MYRAFLAAIVSAIFCSFLVMCSSENIQQPATTIYPPSLKPGDKIAILAPAGPVDSALVDSAADVIRQAGYEPVIYPTAYGKFGYFSAPHRQRLADLRDALTDTSIHAILCARGGYGAAILLDSLARLPLADNPKWLIGFSDISALHALLASRGIASIHASMAKQLAKGLNDSINAALLAILAGDMPSYTFPTDSLSRPGRAEGPMLGGNLAVIQALIDTPYDIIQPGSILFIEDVAEPIYKVQRIMYQLRMAGVFDKINGLVVGQFTDYKPDSAYTRMEDMIVDAVADYPGLPVAFNAPVGHVDENVPFVESARAVLEICPDSTRIKFSR